MNKGKQSNKTVKSYLEKDYSSLQPINKRKEEQLCEKIRQGNLDALDNLVNTYLNLVDIVALKYDDRGIDFGELQQIGKIGLVKAANRYTEDKGVNFRAYATWWIRQSILKALHEQARINHIPEILITQIWDVARGFDYDESRNDREPSNREICDFLKLQIDEIAKIHHNIQSFDQGRLSA